MKKQNSEDRSKKGNPCFGGNLGVFEKGFGRDYRIYEDIVNHEFTRIYTNVQKLFGQDLVIDY
ncbi:MAG: hypothetical protein CEE38_12160 [Planctomycetes bacterium B3_Pla]|nr:MAG: hypothetical protein CEE38_12160 [Planctomycetes bacterium B3_Pla]